MSVLDYFNEKYYAVAAGGSLLVAGAASLVATPALGILGIVVGAGAGVASMVTATIFRPAEEIDSTELIIEKILQEANSTPELEMGGARTKSRVNADLAKVREFANLASHRRGILGETFLVKISDMATDLTKILNNPTALEGNTELALDFDSLIHRNLIETLNIFCQTPGAATNENLRNEFAKQLNDLHVAIENIQGRIDDSAIRQFQGQGFYLETKYNPENKLESE